MIKLSSQGIYLINGREIVPDDANAESLVAQRTPSLTSRKTARQGTMAYSILRSHNTSDDLRNLRLRFDALASHDITHVSIIQTARASGLQQFPVPYVLTNCHNSLAAVGGTINADDHAFALSAAKKYGGIFVPPHLAVIHQYMREMFAGGNKMILGSDSHTRYGALGTLGIGEGGGELVKQILGETYDIPCPEVVAVYLHGNIAPGVGPQDVALAIIGAVFKKGYVKDKIMEFVGPGIEHLSVEFRHGIDVMTAETTCLSSIWRTDDKVEQYLALHGRAADFARLEPANIAYYDGLIDVDLSAVKPMMALPFHPSHVFPIEEVQANGADILNRLRRDALTLTGFDVGADWVGRHWRNGKFIIDQAVIAGCAGGMFENIVAAADIIGKGTAGDAAVALNIYPSSQPQYADLVRNGTVNALMSAGAIVRTAFCGPCFGAGDVPSNHGFSIRHTTRNFLHREGSTPTDAQLAFVGLMDSRSIAATAANGGQLTSATQVEVNYTKPAFYFDHEIYARRVYNGFGKPEGQAPIALAPNITDWPAFAPLPEHLLLRVASVLRDPVTTTDDLLPSGEISSFRSNPLRLAEYTLSRKDPKYLAAAKAIQAQEMARQAGRDVRSEIPELLGFLATERDVFGDIGIGSVVVARKIGDGSAREQAASSQRVLGGWANLAQEYATRRYRANLINWGIIPFVLPDTADIHFGDYLFVPFVRRAIIAGHAEIAAHILRTPSQEVSLTVGLLNPSERDALLKGGLINLYRRH